MAVRADRHNADTQIPAAQRKEQRVHQHQRHAPEFAHRHAAQQQRHGHDRQHRQHAVKRRQRIRHQLAEDHVVAPEVRQEQKTQRALALFFAQAIRRVPDTAEQAVEARAASKQSEQDHGDLMGWLILRDEEEPRGDDQDHQGRSAAQPVGAATPRGDAQFPGYDRQEGHVTAEAG